MKNLYDLTNPQKGIWLTEQYYNGTSIANISGTILINETVDFEKLEKALNIYIQKNDAIRLHLILTDEGNVKQYISDYKEFNIPIVNVKDDTELHTLTQNTVNTPFTLIDSDLFKFTLFRFPDKTGGLQVTFHHIVSDAWTMSLFIDETMNIYSKLLKNEKIDLDKNPSYLNYIENENKYLSSTKFETDKEFWNNIFNYEPEIATVKLYKNNEKSTKAVRKIFTLDKQIYNKIQDFCTKNKLSIFTFLMSIYSIYLSKINNLENVTIAAPILNRSNFSEKHTAGMFISTVPFSFNIDAGKSFSEFVINNSKLQMSIFRHQKYPYQTLLEDIKKNYSNVNNLYDIALSYQNARDNHESSDINYKTNWLFNNNISDSLEIHFYDMDNLGTLDIYYDYKTEKFDEKEIIDINNRIFTIINQVLEDNDKLIKNIEIVTSDEKDLILKEFNNTFTNYPRNKNVIELFNEQVTLNPNSTAVIFEDISLTYKELNDKANCLANYLINQNIKSQDVVAIFMDKSLEAIISILAILKIGAIYLPIDILYPNDRVEYILQDSNAKCILTCNQFLSELNYNLPNYVIDLSTTSIYDNTCENITTSNSTTDIAYIMYTSGSTGKPKGVLITHQGIVRLVKNTNYIKFSKQDKILQTGSIVFDACTFEIWGALLNGLELYLLKKSDLLNPVFFEKYIIKNNITTLFLTTALFNKFCEANALMFRNLKYLLTGGEAVSKKHMKIVKDANPNLNLVHVYGPTENTTFSTYYYVEKDSYDTIPIRIPYF